MRAFEEDTDLSESNALVLAYLVGELALRLDDPASALTWFDRAQRMEGFKAHPQIGRLTRDRWSDARAQTQQDRSRKTA